MTRALKYDIPGIDWRLDPEKLLEAGHPGLFFEEHGPSRLVVDIGFGRGEFLIEQASNDAEAVYLGIEISHKRCLKMARRLARTDLTNVRLIEMRAERAVRDLLPWSSVFCFWINYPDPWPKKRHHGRRIIDADFVRELALRLQQGGSVQVATDHEDYAEVIDSAFEGEALLRNDFAPHSFLRGVAGRMPTNYELEWRAQGRALHYFKYVRCSP